LSGIDQKIDYVVLTYNSGKTLDRCLTNIKKYGNPNQIFVIDKCSRDNTIEIAKRHLCTIVSKFETLGMARMRGIKMATTDWFVFIDSDVFICAEWENMFRYLNIPYVGAIQATPHNWKLRKTVYSLPYTPKLKGEWRGFAGAVILKKDLVKDCDISFCQALEDWFLQRHIISKGYKWLVVPVVVEHKYGNIDNATRKMWNASALSFYFCRGYLSFFLYLLLIFKYVSWFASHFMFSSIFWFVLGLFRQKYFDLRR